MQISDVMDRPGQRFMGPPRGMGMDGPRPRFHGPPRGGSRPGGPDRWGPRGGGGGGGNPANQTCWHYMRGFCRLESNCKFMHTNWIIIKIIVHTTDALKLRVLKEWMKNWSISSHLYIERLCFPSIVKICLFFFCFFFTNRSCDRSFFSYLLCNHLCAMINYCGEGKGS